MGLPIFFAASVAGSGVEEFGFAVQICSGGQGCRYLTSSARHAGSGVLVPILSVYCLRCGLSLEGAQAKGWQMKTGINHQGLLQTWQTWLSFSQASDQWPGFFLWNTLAP